MIKLLVFYIGGAPHIISDDSRVGESSSTGLQITTCTYIVPGKDIYVSPIAMSSFKHGIYSDKQETLECI